eukprot:130175_1
MSLPKRTKEEHDDTEPPRKQPKASTSNTNNQHKLIRTIDVIYDENAIQELLNEGLTLEESKKVIEMSHFEDMEMKIIFEDQYDDIKNNSSHCLHNCLFFKRFLQVMNMHSNKHTDDINIKNALDDYLHLLHEHDNDEDFEVIVNTLQCCNIRQCSGFKRNGRDRSKNDANEENANMALEILDKIHCYFMHSYDVGYRLTVDEKTKISIDKYESKTKDLDFTDMTLLNMKQLLSQKQNMLQDVIAPLNSRKKIMFHFGIPFFYGDEYNQSKTWRDHNYDIDFVKENFKRISPKYASLKEELTGNTLAVLTIEQFNNEYGKALLHFDSEFCKRSFPSIPFEYILSLMVYCNYTHLQYEFSKTYRMNSSSDFPPEV